MKFPTVSVVPDPLTGLTNCVRVELTFRKTGVARSPSPH